MTNLWHSDEVYYHYFNTINSNNQSLLWSHGQVV